MIQYPATSTIYEWQQRATHLQARLALGNTHTRHCQDPGPRWPAPAREVSVALAWVRVALVSGLQRRARADYLLLYYLAYMIYITAPLWKHRIVVPVNWSVAVHVSRSSGSTVPLIPNPICILDARPRRLVDAPMQGQWQRERQDPSDRPRDLSRHTGVTSCFDTWSRLAHSHRGSRGPDSTCVPCPLHNHAVAHVAVRPIQSVAGSQRPGWTSVVSWARGLARRAGAAPVTF